MRYKGHSFRHNARLVALPSVTDSGGVPDYVDPKHASGAYVWFGRVTADAQAPGAVRTRYTRADGSPVYAVPVPLDGHSLTNMAYGTKKEVYLMHDGACYQARLQA